MSAQRLRDAAKVLRGRAGAATPGLWEDVPMGSEGSTVLASRQTATRSILTTRRVGRFPEFADATYIATMSPPLALALADLLEFLVGFSSVGMHGLEDEFLRDALAIADLILGADS